ncbi:UbiH/UbiF/VisC/COQ6 family ubiquinone biosynthesis hydroxylase [soil metagenome]
MNTPSPPFEIAIHGAGPVGCALALMLTRLTGRAASIALLDRQVRERAFDDVRSIALSAGSLALLAPLIDLDTLVQAPIRSVHVSQRGVFGRTVLLASEQGLERLGAVVRYGALMRVLDRAVAASGVVAAYAIDADAIRGPRWSARVAVHAEGRSGQSVDEASLLPALPAQSAIVCEVSATRSLRDVAFERFTAEGPIALLPLPEPDRHAVVWCQAPDAAAAIAALDDAAFCSRLAQRFGSRLGRLHSPGARAVIALASARDSRETDAGSVRIGNAAQTLHPVAGQGLNLGLRDAALLADALARADGEPAAALDRFRRVRESDRAGTMALTELFAHGFGGPRGSWLAPLQPLSRLAGAAVLTAIDALPPLRRRFARRMIYGIRD